MSNLVQHQAPDFTCAAILPDGSIVDAFALKTAIAGKYAALVFYPLDFTFVCPTELIALDKQGIVRAQHVNDLPLGRNIDELLRLVDALQFHEEHGEVCPAGWSRGEVGMKANAEGVAAYLSHRGAEL